MLILGGVKVVGYRRSGKLALLVLENGNELLKSKIKYVDVYCDECGKSETFLFKVKYINGHICRSCRYKGKGNPFYGKSHSKEVKEKISKSKDGMYVGEKNPMYGKSVYDVWVEKYGKEEADRREEERKQKVSKSVSGEKNPFYGKQHTKETTKIIREKNKRKWKDKRYKKRMSAVLSEAQKRSMQQNPEYYKKIKQEAARISNANQERFTMNNPETKFHNILNEHGIEHDYSPILGNFQYDFKVKNKRILIEIQGDYWHGNPELYDELNHIQEKKQNRDEEKRKFAESHNFKLIEVWESDLKDTEKIQGVIDEIKKN